MSPRTLVVMRHAHAADGAWEDHERPLTARGQREATAQGALVARLGWGIDHLLCSDAVRTQETLTFLQLGLGRPVPNVVSEALYLPSVEVMRSALAAAPDVAALWILSHNPSCEALVQSLGRAVVALPPATLVRLVGEGPDWATAMAGPWTVLDVLRP